MPLNDAELVTVAEITLELFSVVEERAALLNDEQVSSIQDDLDTWEVIRDSHVRLKGGSDGVDFDNERKRAAIRERIRKILGLPLYSSESANGSGSSFAIQNVSVW